MKKISEYRQHAAECRALASSMDVEKRALLLDMAATWERLAAERAEMVKRHPDRALPGELGVTRH